MRRVLVAIILGLSIFSFSIPNVFSTPQPNLITLDGTAKLTPTCQVDHCNIDMGGLCCFSTTKSNDVLIVFVYLINETVISVQDQAGLTFKLRLSQWQIAEYYAIAPSPLNNDNVSVTTTTTHSCSAPSIFCGGTLTALNGVYTNSPFDVAAGVPLEHDGIATCTANFGSPVLPFGDNELMIVGFGTDGAGSFAPGPGFTLITIQNRAASEYQYIPTRTEINIQGNYPGNCPSQSHTGLIADLLCASSCGGAGGNARGPPPNFQSVPGLGGLPIPPQLGDNGVLGFIFLVSATIGISSLEFPKREKKTRSVYG